MIYLLIDCVVVTFILKEHANLQNFLIATELVHGTCWRLMTQFDWIAFHVAVNIVEQGLSIVIYLLGDDGRCHLLLISL